MAGFNPPKEVSSGYLKLAVVLCNENQDVDFKLGRPLNLADLDNLSSENMLKIVNTLMSKVIQEKQVLLLYILQLLNKSFPKSR